MRPLRRDTQATRAAEIVRRVESLERRIYPSIISAYAEGPAGVTSVTTNTAYLGMETALTNDAGTFTHMPYSSSVGNSTSVDNGSLVILKNGLYLILSKVLIDTTTIGATSFEHYIASAENTGTFILDQNMGSHQSATSIRPNTTTALWPTYWNLITLDISTTNVPCYLKPYTNSGDASYDLTGWALLVWRLTENYANYEIITDEGLPPEEELE